jgi:hypothetical protein
VPPSTTVYFDTTDATNCLALLNPDLRGSVTIPWLAGECEADVLNAFTKQFNPITYVGYPIAAVLPISFASTSVFTDLGNGLGVFLRGYTVDPTQCTDPLFVKAIRRTIAGVITWRWPQTQRDPQVKQASGAGSLSAGQKTWSSYDPLPPAWDRYLKPYDTRDIGWGI